MVRMVRITNAMLQEPMHLGLIGFGNIGRALAQRLPRDVVDGFTVLLARPEPDVPGIAFTQSVDALIASAPALVVECAGHAAARSHLVPLLEAGISVMPASLGVFTDDDFLQAVRAAAARSRSTVIFPAGAIGGLDLLRALSAQGPVQVRYRGIKPPAAWRGSPADTLVDLAGLTERTVFFSGSARAAAATFPKNANVVAALALAGPGFENVEVALIADPAASGNTHSYSVASAVCSYDMTIENAASAGNARTSETTILSLLSEVQTFAQRLGTAP